MSDRVITKLVVEKAFLTLAFGLDIFEISDRVERAIVVHDLPYRDGAILEDLGSHARVVNIRCAFYEHAVIRLGLELPPTYSNHFLFLDAIQNDDVVEFHHPKYGVMKGKVQNIDVINNQLDEYAQVSFAFIEGLEELPSPPAFEVVSAVNDAFRSAQGLQLDAIKNSIKAALDASTAVEVLDQAVDFTQDMADQITGVSNIAREFIRAVDTIVNKFDSILGNIEQPAKSILTTITYTQDLPGRLLYSVAQTTERYQQLYAGIEGTPVTYVQSFMGGMEAMKAAFVGYAQETLAVDQVTALKAQWGCIMGARVLRTDEDSRDELRMKEAEKTFDLEGNLVGSIVLPNIMTVTDIERILYDTKTAAQDTIDAARDNRALKLEISALQDFVNNTKLERIRLKTISISNMPLHVVCLQQGLSYQMAERILKLNPKIKNPTFVDGDIDVYGR